MKKLIYLKDGNDLFTAREALFLENISDGVTTWGIYYVDGRVIECDSEDREIKSHNLMVMLQTSYTNNQ